MEMASSVFLPKSTPMKRRSNHVYDKPSGETGKR